jgi:hypothetical protein
LFMYANKFVNLSTVKSVLRWPNTPGFCSITYIKSVLIIKFNMSSYSGNKN